jgi:diguanylate cyclase (GGDEF)-like protein/PAS domain S-box-containing protein
MVKDLSKKISILNQAVLESVSLASEKDIVGKLIKAGIKVLDADYGYCYLLSEDRKKFELLYKTSSTPYTPQVPRPQGTIAKAFTAKAPRLIENVQKVGTVRADAKENMRGVAVIPVIYKRAQYGALVICYKKSHTFTPEEKVLCDFLGNSAAQAITINRLYSNLRDFKHTLDNTLDSIFMMDPQSRRITYVNKGTLTQLDWKKSELIKAPFSKIIHKSEVEELAKKIEHIVNSEVSSSLFEITLVNREGTKIPAEVLLQYIELPDQPAYLLGIVRDISERKKSQEEIKRAAFHDALTGLPNRLMFTEQLQETMRVSAAENKKFALIFMDFDRFKFINDILGHMTGDQLLQQAGKRLKQSIKKGDLVSRFGGDEFVILLRNIQSSKNVDLIAERIRQCFQEPFKLGGQEIYINVSMGISAFPKDGTDPDVLLKNADNALYRAKQQGGNVYLYYNQNIAIPKLKQLELEKQLRQAIKNDELLLYYQPVVDLKTQSIVAAEGLLRWNHPTLGLISPGDFIAHAEESGLIVNIGEWVIKQACKQMYEWKQQGLYVPVSINVSPRELLQRNFVPKVQKIMAQYELPSQDLALELTETFLIKNMEVSISILEQFRSLGFKLMIDDFGTGYASLNYLKQLPIDEIKIDQSFIHGSTTDSQDAGIIKAIISMARHLQLKVVAEGVETEDQLKFLLNQNCDLMQGNFYSPAVPETEFLKLLRKPKRLLGRPHN